MTENEAKLILDVRISRFDHANDVNEALEVAKSSLEEIQKYRKLGTVDQIEERMLLTAADETILREYKELGVVQELREAMEKQRAKKPIDVKGNVNGLVHKCPNCGADYNRFYEGKPYCMFCGQAIDWSDEE